MSDLIKFIFPLLTLLADIGLIVLALSLWLNKSWREVIVGWLGTRVLSMGFIFAALAVVGSLSYSNIVGYEPCVLCWWQRIFIYPQAILFLLAWLRKDFAILRYTLWLAIIAATISLYHVNLHWGGISILPCDATGPACDKVFVKAYGYITIPFMALTTSLAIILLSKIRRIYENRNT